MLIIYNLLLTLLFPLWVPWMLWRSMRRKEKPIWKERFGDYDIRWQKGSRRIWIHAVSVGEVMAVLPILKELKRSKEHFELVLSVTTSSGHRTAREQTEGLVDHLVYFPIDVLRFQLAGVSRVRPLAVAIMETELWFNFLWSAKSFDARTLLVNGRIGDNSFRRSKYIRPVYRAMLKLVDRCLMQTDVDADRIKAMGALSVETFGNCKYDQAVSGLDAKGEEWRKELGLPEGLPVVVVGSTRGEDEENLVLESLRTVGPERLAVVFAPRHLERADALAISMQASFGAVARRSQKQQGQFILLDTYGELGDVYSVADVVIIGGGFGAYGGQNLIQPLAHGVPVLHGPNMFNFRDAASAADRLGAAICCHDSSELATNLSRLLGSESERTERGNAAKSFVKSNLGAAQRYAEAIIEEALRAEESQA